MFSPGAFSGLGFGSGAPSAPSVATSVDAGAPSINPDLVAALQSQLGEPTDPAVQGQYGRASYPGGSSLTWGAGPTAEAQAALDAADAAGRGFLGFGRGTVTQDPYTGQVTTGRGYGLADAAQVGASLAFPAIGGILVSGARGIAGTENPYETQLGYGYKGQPNRGTPEDFSMDMISVPSQEEMAAAQPAQPAQPPTPGVAGAPQAFGSPGPYDEYRARIGLGGIGVDPFYAHSAGLMRRALS